MDLKYMATLRPNDVKRSHQIKKVLQGVLPKVNIVISKGKSDNMQVER